jgi:DNA modification methylase
VSKNEQRAAVDGCDGREATIATARSLELHPTVKPVQLVMDALPDCSNRDDVVIDSFLGSGTTLLATGRGSRERTSAQKEHKALNAGMSGLTKKEISALGGDFQSLAP